MDLLRAVEFTYNSKRHAGLSQTPIRAIYRVDPIILDGIAIRDASAKKGGAIYKSSAEYAEIRTRERVIIKRHLESA